MMQFLFVEIADTTGVPIKLNEMAEDLGKLSQLLDDGYTILKSDPDYHLAPDAQIVTGWNLLLYKPAETSNSSNQQQIASEQPGDEIQIVEVSHYLSNSGNPTWKATSKDGEIIYLRQAYRKQLEEAGLWNVLNQMQIGDTWPVNDGDLTITARQDGDFLRPVAYRGTISNPWNEESQNNVPF